MFCSELQMSKNFECFIQSNFGNTYVKELTGLFGIPDFVFLHEKNNDISIVAFELKLQNWKKAIVQAFRYRSFSNISYVVMPVNKVSAAAKNINMFKQFNVGLATFDIEMVFNVIFEPNFEEPFSDQMHDQLLEQTRSIIEITQTPNTPFF